MKLRKMLCPAVAAMLLLSLDSCAGNSGNPESVAQSEETETTAVATTTTTGTTVQTHPIARVADDNFVTETETTTAATYTTTERLKYTDIVFTKQEILRAAGIRVNYLSSSFIVVDNVVPSYGEATPVCNVDEHLILPAGFTIDYVTDIVVEHVPRGKTVTVTGNVALKIIEIKDEVSIPTVRTEASGPFTLVKTVE